jgi:microcystin degradation protein MlrC
LCLVSPQAWERRQEFVCPLRNPAEAIDQAMALCSQGKAGDGPIVLPDMSDNPGERRIQLYTPGLRLAKFECLILIDFRIRLTCCFVGGGGTSDSIVILQEMLARGVSSCVIATIVDPAVVDLCHSAGVGGRVAGIAVPDTVHRI